MHNNKLVARCRNFVLAGLLALVGSASWAVGVIGGSGGTDPASDPCTSLTFLITSGQTDQTLYFGPSTGWTTGCVRTQTYFSSTLDDMYFGGDLKFPDQAFESLMAGVGTANYGTFTSTGYNTVIFDRTIHGHIAIDFCSFSNCNVYKYFILGPEVDINPGDFLTIMDTVTDLVTQVTTVQAISNAPYAVDIFVAQVPEPETAFLLSIALLGIVVTRRGKSRR
jgi:hypothetical protein